MGPGVVERLTRARAIVDRAAEGDTPVYGLNSALGANTGAPLAPGEQGLYQVRAVRARAVSVGPPLGDDVVRAAMFVRAAGMARGGSGVSVPVFRALVDALNAGIVPHVPSRGSIGVADLSPLAHIALVLIGEGEARVDGARIPGADALAAAGLAPVALAAKDGLALISANAVTVGHASLVLADLARALALHSDIVALSFEAFRANLSPLDPRAQAARPAPGQAEAATRILVALAGSALAKPGAARRVQDPLSFRCVPQVHGVLHDALARAIDHVEIELNAKADSPLADRRRRPSLLDRKLPHPRPHARARDARSRGRAGGVARRGALPQAALALDVRPAFAAHAPWPAAVGLRDRTEAADRARDRDPPPRESRLARLPAGVGGHRGSRDDGAGVRRQARGDARMLRGADRDRSRDRGPGRGSATRDVRATLGSGAARIYEGVRARVAVLDDDRPLAPDFEAIADWIDSGAP